MTTDRYLSPLRYPGGKTKIANFIKLLLIENDLVGVDYVEPYAGGASVALALLFEGYAEHVHINDLNKSVAAFWQTVVSQPDALCDAILDTPVMVGEWKRQRVVQSDENASQFDLALSTFFLNRTNRSGIISGGGVIGGLDQKGQWGIDARYNKQELCMRIQKIGRFRSRITVSQVDAYRLLHDETVVHSGTFVYADPPYYVKGEGLYDNFYTHEDHQQMAEAIQQIGCPWVVSYDTAVEINAMYETCRSLRYALGHSASDFRLGSESMFFSSDLKVPPVSSAAGISNSQVARSRNQLVII